MGLKTWCNKHNGGAGAHVPHESLVKHPRCPQGRLNYCRECFNKEKQSKYRNNERYRQQERAHEATRRSKTREVLVTQKKSLSSLGYVIDLQEGRALVVKEDGSALWHYINNKKKKHQKVVSGDIVRTRIIRVKSADRAGFRLFNFARYALSFAEDYEVEIVTRLLNLGWQKQKIMLFTEHDIEHNVVPEWHAPLENNHYMVQGRECQEQERQEEQESQEDFA